MGIPVLDIFVKNYFVQKYIDGTGLDLRKTVVFFNFTTETERSQTGIHKINWPI